MFPAARLTPPSQAPQARLRVAVGLSGGVDSSVALLKLRDAGHEVTALFMKNWEEDDAPGHCAAARDLADAQRVCERLGVALRTVNFAAEYWERVFEAFLAEHAAGRTPNPDVLCNAEIKFRAFLDFALDLGADCIATGHYARVSRGPGGPRLLRGVDGTKDQSYFLHALDPGQLGRALFPLGGLDKAAVRALARRAGLATHDKKDSTGICFIGERPFREFLARYLPSAPGPIESPEGRTLGEHSGLAYYTLGQRQGLGIGGRRDAGGAPWYVAHKDLARNALVVVQGHDHPLLFSGALEAGRLNWIAGAAPDRPLRCTAKTRYRQPDQPCTVEALDGGRVHVRFDEAQRAVTPGQSVVFYAGEQCLGGGVIEARSAAAEAS